MKDMETMHEAEEGYYYDGQLELFPLHALDEANRIYRHYESRIPIPDSLLNARSGEYANTSMNQEIKESMGPGRFSYATVIDVTEIGDYGGKNRRKMWIGKSAGATMCLLVPIGDQLAMGDPMHSIHTCYDSEGNVKYIGGLGAGLYELDELGRNPLASDHRTDILNDFITVK